MTTRRRHYWFLLLALIVSTVAVLAAADDEEADPEPATPFEPIKFTPPKLNDKPHLFETFADKATIGKRWLKSTAKKQAEGVEEEVAKYNGEWEIGPPSDVIIDGDLGLVVKNKARHHAIAAALDRPFTFDGTRPLVVQYEVQYENGQECGGGYLKLLTKGPDTQNLADFKDATPYTIMFGPDKCGASSKLHFILRLQNPKNQTISEHHVKQSSSVRSEWFDDHKSHLYTLVFHPDGRFSISVDNSQVAYGNANKDLQPDVTPPKLIVDPSDVKPADWDERPEIDDDTAEKPEDWDEQAPREIVDDKAVKPDDWLEDELASVPDPAAKQPADWDIEMDGEWEAPLVDNPACEGRSGCGPWKPPMVANPNYKGKWKRPRVKNPNYSGVWTPKLIENPNFYEPDAFKDAAPISAIGLELWTMSDRIIFDNILVTDDEELARSVAAQTFDVRKAEQKRAAVARGEANGTWLWVQQQFEEKPWLWAALVLIVLLPIILISIYCFGGSGGPVSKADKAAAAARKKNDDLQNVDEEEEDDAEMEEPIAAEATTTAKKTEKAVARSRDELEESDEEEEQEEEGHDEEPGPSGVNDDQEEEEKVEEDTKKVRRRGHARKE